MVPKRQTKISPKNSFLLPRNCKKTEMISQFMTSMTMFTPSQNPFNFVVGQNPYKSVLTILKSV